LGEVKREKEDVVVVGEFGADMALLALNLSGASEYDINDDFQTVKNTSRSSS
jgi:hypothetical protein